MIYYSVVSEIEKYSTWDTYFHRIVGLSNGYDVFYGGIDYPNKMSIFKDGLIVSSYDLPNFREISDPLPVKLFYINKFLNEEGILNNGEYIVETYGNIRCVSDTSIYKSIALSYVKNNNLSNSNLASNEGILESVVTFSGDGIVNTQYGSCSYICGGKLKLKQSLLKYKIEYDGAYNITIKDADQSSDIELNKNTEICGYVKRNCFNSGSFNIIEVVTDCVKLTAKGVEYLTSKCKVNYEGGKIKQSKKNHVVVSGKWVISNHGLQFEADELRYKDS